MTGLGSATRRGYGADWRRVRLVVLERDGWICHWDGAPANTVDHVRPLAMGGARLDPANLVACCRSCNSRRGAAVANRRRSSLAPGSGYLVATTAAVHASSLHGHTVHASRMHGHARVIA